MRGDRRLPNKTRTFASFSVTSNDGPLPPKAQKSEEESKKYWAAIDARQRALPRTGFPKGVFRFKSFEEADEWERKMRARIFPNACEHGWNLATLAIRGSVVLPCC